MPVVVHDAREGRRADAVARAVRLGHAGLLGVHSAGRRARRGAGDRDVGRGRREIERQMDKRDEVMESEKRRNSKKPAGRYLRVAPSRWELQVPKTLTTTGSIKPLKPAKKVRKKRISPAEWGEAMVFEDEIRNSVREAHREQLTGALEVIELDP